MFNTYIVIHQQKQKQFFPQKICFPKGSLPLENEIAVVMSKAFGQRKRKYKFKKHDTFTAASHLVAPNNHQMNILIIKDKIFKILIMFIASINCSTFAIFGKWVITEIAITTVFVTYHNERPSIYFNLAMYD